MTATLSNQKNTITDTAHCVVPQDFAPAQKGATNTEFTEDMEMRNMALLALAISGGLLMVSMYIALF